MRGETSVTSDAARWRAAFLTAFTLQSLVKLLLAMRLSPFVDEAFYWQESRHLAWGYSDLPPLTAWLIRGGDMLAGHHGVLAMRWPFLLLGATLPWMVVAFARRGFGERRGWQAGLWCLALPLAGTLGVLALPDVPLTAACMLALLALSSAMARDRWRDWIVLGLALALAWLVHYRAGMLVLAGAMFLLLAPRGRQLWRRPGLYLAIGVACLGLVPLIVSNIQLHGAGLSFQLLQRNPWRFHADALVQPLEQALACTPLLYALLLWAGWKSIERARSRVAGDWDLIAIAAGTFLAGYFLFGLFADDTHFRAHWPLPGYLPLLAALPVILGDIATRSRRLLVAAVASVAMLGQALMLLWLMTATTPTQAAWLHGGKAYSGAFTGWRESAALVREQLAGMPRDARLVADNFELAAELDFQLDGQRPVYVLDSPLNRKHGRRAQLRAWGLDGDALRARHAGAPMLLVVEESALPEREQPGVLGALCRRIVDPRRVASLSLDQGRKRIALYAGRVPAGLLPAMPRDNCGIWMHAYHGREAARMHAEP